MRNLIAIIQALHVPVSEVTFWDETRGVQTAESLVEGDNVLAEHITQRGNAGLLCYWMQHKLDDPDPAYDPPACPCRGGLQRLVNEQGFWRLDQAGQPLQNLDFIREIRNPWYSDAGCCAPCFYLTPVANADVHTTLIFNSPDALQVDYEIAGRLIGFDFPQSYLDRERSLGTRP